MKTVQPNHNFAPDDRNHQRGRGERKKQLMEKDLPPMEAEVERLKHWKRRDKAEKAPLCYKPRQRLSLSRAVEGNCRSRSGCSGHDTLSLIRRCSILERYGATSAL